MPLEDACRDLVDHRAVGDVTHLPLRAELVRNRRQPILPPREEYETPAALGQLPRGHLPDSGRRPGHDRYAP